MKLTHFVLSLLLLTITTSIWAEKNPSTIEELTQAIVSTGSEAEAMELLEKNRLLLGRPLWEALIQEGEKIRNAGDYKTALRIFQISLRVAKQIDDLLGVARSINSTGVLYYMQSNLDTAYEHFQQSLKICEQIKDNFCIANALTNLGLVEETWGEYEKALKHHETALKLRTEIGHMDRVGISLNNIANIYYFRGDYDLALEYYDNALKKFEELKDKHKEATALNNIGTCYQQIGNHRLSLQYLEKSLAVRKELNDKRGISTSFLNIGNVYFEQLNYDLALDYYVKSLKLSEELQDRIEEARVTYNIAGVFSKQKEFDKALELYRKSLTIRQELDDQNGIGESLGKIGEVLALKGDHIAAVEYLQQSLNVREKLGDQNGLVFTLVTLAASLNHQKKFDEALQYAERAATLASKIGVAGYLWQAKTEAGKAHAELKQLKEALRCFEDAISAVEKMRWDIAGDESIQQRFFENKLTPYHKIVELLADQDLSEEALTNSERAKARVLLDTIGGNRTLIQSAMTSEERSVELDLHGRIASLNTKLRNLRQSKTSDPQELTTALNEIQQARMHLEEFRMKVYAAHPGLRIKKGEVDPFQLNEANQLFADSEMAVLDYVVTETKVILFVLTTDGTKVSLTMKSIGIDPGALSELIHEYRNSIATRHPGFSIQARKLYEILIYPAASEIKQKKSLILLPDSMLWDLPFQTLMDDRDQYLLENHSISYVPSLTVLREMLKRKRNINRETSLLAFGDPSFVTDPQLSNQKDSMVKSIPNSKKEVRALGPLYGEKVSKIYTGVSAQEKRFKLEAKNFSVIHLATHGILNDGNPLYSNILFSQSGDQMGEDGLLETWEILDIDAPAELVVLSACETARGRITTGEGLIGFSWAFFVAGSTTTVVSQWKVDSESTTELMYAFHKNMRSGNNQARAMQTAALQIMKIPKFRHPFYWAAFIVVGTSTSV